MTGFLSREGSSQLPSYLSVRLQECVTRAAHQSLPPPQVPFPTRMCLLRYTQAVPSGRSPLSRINGTEAEVSKCKESPQWKSRSIDSRWNRASFCFSRYGWPGRDGKSHHDGPRRHEHASNGQRTWHALPGFPNISTCSPRGPSVSKHCPTCSTLPRHYASRIAWL